MSERHPPKREYLTREDRQLWAHVVRSVRPFRGRTAFEVPEEFAAPEPGASPALPAPPPQTPVKPGAPTLPPPLQPLERRMRQRLRRGQNEVEGVLDLHGLRQSEAHAALLAFIHRAHRERRTLVLVITGKGGGGESIDRDGRGVLARLVPHWLADPVIRREVIGFEPAGPGHGGAGALYVRIRKSRGVT